MRKKAKPSQLGWMTAVFAAGTAVLLSLFPAEMLTVLTIWILASFPIGVLIGHCILSEAPAPPDQ
jgi:hypothetical protein